MTKYEKIRKELHEALAEFTRLTGTGNVKLANLVMIQIVHFLVDLIEHQPKTSCQCGGQCGCGNGVSLAPLNGTMKPPVTALPVPPVMVVPDDVTDVTDVHQSSELDDDSDMVRLIEPVKSEEVEPPILEQVSEVPVQDDEVSTPELEEELVAPKPKRGRRI